MLSPLGRVWCQDNSPCADVPGGQVRSAWGWPTTGHTSSRTPRRGGQVSPGWETLGHGHDVGGGA